MSTTTTTKHLKLEWHSSKDLLAVSSINSNSGGFISFFTKKVLFYQKRDLENFLSIIEFNCRNKENDIFKEKYAKKRFFDLGKQF